ncbi:MAG: acyltransferase [Armatimonadota bacterium]
MAIVERDNRTNQEAGNSQGLAASRLEAPFIHPLAEVESGARIGAGAKIWRFAHVRAGAVIGADTMIGNFVYVDAGVEIGSRVKIQNGVLVYSGVTIEDEVFLGPAMAFTNDLFPRSVSPDWVLTPTRVCRGASIGANATVICGVTIGAYAMVAAGSVVTHDVAAHALVRGNPARAVGYVCACGHKLGDMKLDITAPHTCRHCGQEILIAA